MTFNRARRGRHPYSAHGGIVVALKDHHAGRIADVVIGNDIVTRTVVMQNIALDGGGRIMQRVVDPFICVVQVLK